MYLKNFVVFNRRLWSLCCGCVMLGAGKTCSSFPSVNYVTRCDAVAVISVTLFVSRKDGNMTRLLLHIWFAPRFVAVFLWVQYKEKVAPCGCSKNKPGWALRCCRILPGTWLGPRSNVPRSPSARPFSLAYVYVTSAFKLRCVSSEGHHFCGNAALVRSGYIPFGLSISFYPRATVSPSPPAVVLPAGPDAAFPPFSAESFTSVASVWDFKNLMRILRGYGEGCDAACVASVKRL